MLFVRGRFEPFMWMHTFFMQFALDIVFLDSDDVIIRIDRSLRPWRVSSPVLRARKVVEMKAGRCARTGTEVGDRIQFEAAR